MRIWADVYDAIGNRLGDGPIVNVRSASINRILDSIGDFSIDIAGGDGRALNLLQPERRVIVYVEEDGRPREMLRGIVRNLVWNEAGGGKNFTVSGPDILNELSRANLFYNAVYNNQSAQTILNSAFTHSPAWEVVCDDNTLTTLGFNGASVFTVVREVAKSTGLHFRLEDGRRLLFDIMGDDSGLKIYQSSGHGSFYENPDIALISRLEYRINSENMANKVSPSGADYLSMGLIYGQPQTSYAIQQMVNEFGAIYYLEDTQSIYEYGEIQAVLSYPNIKAASLGIDDQTAGANALYRAASAWLERNNQPQNFYGCTLKNMRKTIRPGQKCFLQYRGDAWQGESQTWPVDILGDLWVIRVTEQVNQGGHNMNLELSEIDQVEQNDNEFIASFMEEVNRLE